MSFLHKFYIILSLFTLPNKRQNWPKPYFQLITNRFICKTIVLYSFANKYRCSSIPVLITIFRPYQNTASTHFSTNTHIYQHNNFIFSLAISNSLYKYSICFSVLFENTSEIYPPVLQSSQTEANP